MANWPSSLRIVLFVSLISAVSIACLTLNFRKVLIDFLAWIKEADLGLFGLLVLVTAYIPLTMLVVPTTVLMLGGGYLFGLPMGFVAGSIGVTAGATASFLLGRRIGRPYVISRLKYNPKLQPVALAIQRSGFKIVFLLRLVPLLRFSMVDYYLSVTPVNIGEYILASWFGMMPITFAIVYVGTTVKDLSDIYCMHGRKWSEVSTTSCVAVGITIVVSVLLIICIMRVIKASLDKVLAENAELEGSFSPLAGLPIQSEAPQFGLHKPPIIKIDSKATITKAYFPYCPC